MPWSYLSSLGILGAKVYSTSAPALCGYSRFYILDLLKLETSSNLTLLVRKKYSVFHTNN